jgi:hypothetical protein
MLTRKTRKLAIKRAQQYRERAALLKFRIDKPLYDPRQAQGYPSKDEPAITRPLREGQ